MRTLCFGLLLLTLSACDPEKPCDEGYTHDQGSCVPNSYFANDAGGGNGGGDDDAGKTPDKADSGSCSEDLTAVLGKTCSKDDECNCAAPFCAIQPGSPTGTCTKYCTTSPDNCPDGYRCFDLSLLGVTGYEPFCTKNN